MFKPRRGRTFTISGPFLPTLYYGAPPLCLSRVGGKDALSNLYQYVPHVRSSLDRHLTTNETAILNRLDLIRREMPVAMTIQLDGMLAWMPGIGSDGISSGKLT